MGHGRRAEPGPAVVLRRERGHSWGGSAKELALLDNTDDIGLLTILDTWVRNIDRCPPEGSARKPNYDNVFFSEEGASSGKFILKAMDHTHCFAKSGELSVAIAGIDHAKEERLYGLFPAFKPFISRAAVERAVERLREIDAEFVSERIQGVPSAWAVSQPVRRALGRLIMSRAEFLAEWMPGQIASVCYPQEEIDFDPAEGGA